MVSGRKTDAICSFELALDLACAAGVVLALAAPAAAQSDYPNRPVRLIIPFPPGGSNDVVGRMIGTSLSDKLGKQVIIDNRPAPAAAGRHRIASKATGRRLHAAGDFVGACGQSVALQTAYDPIKDFVPIGVMGSGPNVVVVHPSLPVNSIKELIALAKKEPGDLQYASGRCPAAFQASRRRVVQARSRRRYPACAVQAAARDDPWSAATQVMFSSLVQTTPHIKTGKLRALGVAPRSGASAARRAVVAEAGRTHLRGGQLVGHRCTAGTPQPIIDKVHAALTAAQDSPRSRSSSPPKARWS